MDIDQLKQELIKQHHAFTAYVDSLSEASFLATPNEKWSAGQQMEHIYMSVHPVAKLVVNKAVMKEKFGTLDRPGRSYENLVAAYQKVLSTGVEAGPRFTPETTPFERKNDLIAGIHQDMESIVSELQNYTEDELDHLAIPHPVMGPFSLREMLMFTIYYVQHHEKKIKENIT